MQKKSKGTVFENLDDETIDMSLFEDSLVEMFRQPPKKKKKKLNHGKKCGEPGAKKKKKKKGKEIKFADGKRQNQIGIVLKKFKLDPGVTRKRVVEMDDENVNLAQVQQLLALLPTEEEVELTNSKFEQFGSIENWGSVERFFYHFSDLDHAKGRLQAWEFQMNFDEYMIDAEDKLTMIFESYDTITGNTRLQIIFKIILRVGNYMNGGTSKGQSFGFSLDILDKLEGTKNIDGQSNLLMYITEFTQKNFPDAMLWEDDFECLVESSRHEIPDIEQEVRKINSKVDELEQVVAEIREQKEKEEAEKKAKKEAEKAAIEEKEVKPIDGAEAQLEKMKLMIEERNNILGREKKKNEEELKDKDEEKAPEDLDKKEENEKEKGNESGGEEGKKEEEDEEEQDNFLSVMEKFKEEYSVRVKKMNDDMELLSETIVKTNKKFAEKPDKTWNEFAAVFKSFRDTWIKNREAIQARKDKEEKEMKKKNKKKNLEKKLKNRPRRATLVENGQIKDESQMKKKKKAKKQALELLAQMIEKATRAERKKGSRHMSFSAATEIHYLCQHCGLRFNSTLQVSGLYFHKCWDDLDSMHQDQPKKHVELSINSDNPDCSFGHRGFCLRPLLPNQEGFSPKNKKDKKKKKGKKPSMVKLQNAKNKRFRSTLGIPHSLMGNRSKSVTNWNLAKKKGFNLGALQNLATFDRSLLGQETIISTTKKRKKKKKYKIGNSKKFGMVGAKRRKKKRGKKKPNMRRPTNFDNEVETRSKTPSIGSNASPNLQAQKQEAEENGERKMSDVVDLPPTQEKNIPKTRSVRFSDVDEQQDVDGNRTEIKCPVWYSRLNQNLKKHIKNLIGDASSSTTDLENLLMDKCGTDRKDVQDLLIWWFGRQQEKFIRKHSKGNGEQTTNMSARMSRISSKKPVEKFVATPMKVTRIRSNDEKQRYIFVAAEQLWWVKQLSEAEATLAGNPPVRFMATKNSIPVRSIANVVAGVESSLFQSLLVQNKEYDTKRCFSIITKEMELNFLCEEPKQRKQWVFNLIRYKKNLLKEDGGQI